MTEKKKKVMVEKVKKSGYNKCKGSKEGIKGRWFIWRRLRKRIHILATELLLNIILRRDDLKVMEVVAQREYKNPMAGGRSITIDIYAVDGDGKVYNVEVQCEPSGADVHRARFHSSMIDTKMLREKQKFKELHDSYVIFITKTDVVGDCPCTM